MGGFYGMQIIPQQSYKTEKISTTSYLLADVETPLDFAMCL